MLTDIRKTHVDKQSRRRECLSVVFGNGLCYCVFLRGCEREHMFDFVDWHFALREFVLST